MKGGVLASKMGMTRLVNSEGLLVPVTQLQILDNQVVDIRPDSHDGISRIVLAANPYKKPTSNKKFHTLKGFVTDIPAEKGSSLSLSGLEEIKEVEISSVSKGKGYQGVMRRHGFHGGPASHGSHFHREPGSIGQRARPGKVMKGKKLPGHLGMDRITLKKRPVIAYDSTKRILSVKGTVPGAKSVLVEVRF